MTHPSADRLMFTRLKSAVRNPVIRERVLDDFAFTFHQLGLTRETALGVAERISDLLLHAETYAEMESTIGSLLARQICLDEYGEKKTLPEMLPEKLIGRAELIFTQIEPQFRDVTGPVLDYGAGDGQVTQLLRDRLSLDIYGVDVCAYKAPLVRVRIDVLKDGIVPVPDRHFSTVVLTNVLHHESDNQKILNEVTRITRDKLVVIETVPVGATPEELAVDFERTFMNDWLYNRPFHPGANIPVPGTYETTEGWLTRFAAKGWTATTVEDLGYDQPAIRDIHTLMVFKR